MNNYSEEKIKIAYELHQKLLEKGEFQKKEDPELFRSYFDTDVREIIQRIFLPVDKAQIIVLEKVMYFVPDVDNEVFAYTNEELRKRMKLDNNKELYFAQFVWINILSEFFGEQFQKTSEIRSFVKVDEILNKVKNHIEKFKKLPADDLFELANEYEMDLQGMIDVWDQLSEVTNSIKDVSRATTKNYGFLLKILRFWEEEKLILLREKQEIYLTEKMKNIASSYYHQETRINEIKELLNKVDEGEKVNA